MIQIEAIASNFTPGLLFYPENHRYELDGRRLDSVTQILQARGFYDPSVYPEHARERGSAVHAACHYHDESDLESETLPEIVKPYLAAYVRFRDENGFEPVYIEEPLGHPEFDYAGTVDRVGYFTKGKYKDLCGLGDLKSGAFERWHVAQLGGYHKLATRNRMADPDFLFIVNLHKDGTYSLVEVKREDAARIWIAAISVHNFINFINSKG